MKKNRTKKQMLKGAALVLAAMAVLWRFTPRSLERVLSMETEAVETLSCVMTLRGVADSEPDSESYTLQAVTPEDGAFQELLGILEQTGYRPDFRNLLPWPTVTVAAENGDDAAPDGLVRSASVSFIWGDRPEEGGHMGFLRSDILCISLRGEAGIRIYHPADRTALLALADCIQRHGEPA